MRRAALLFAAGLGLGILAGTVGQPAAAQTVVRMFGTLVGTAAEPRAVVVTGDGAVLVEGQ